MASNPYGAFAPINEAMRGYMGRLLPMRAVDYGAKFGGKLPEGAGWLERMLGMQSAAPDTSWHDEMVRQALHSNGARAEDEPAAIPLAKRPMRKLPPKPAGMAAQ